MIESKEALIQICGAANVLDSPAVLAEYSRDESFAHPLRPWFVVKPCRREAVQQLVSWANKTRTPLVPVSSGPPHFRGDTVPGAPGAIIVDLSDMNKILEIDRRNRLAMIEPGVTYSLLQPALAEKGLRITATLVPRSNKSVIASLLEREPRLVPRFQWSALDPLRCVEVIWGDGQRLTTGNADAPAQAPYYPNGPAQTDFYRLLSAAQGSMGIVTWASVKCEVLPRVHKLFFIPSRKLDALIDPLYRILKFRFADELLILNSAYLASILEGEAARIRDLAGELPPWVALFGVAGRDRLPRERVEFQEKDLTDLAQSFGLQLKQEISGVRNRKVADAIFSPARAPHWKLEHMGGRQEIFFLTTLDKAAAFTGTVYGLAEALGYNTAEIGVYIQPVQQGVSCHCEFSFPFNPGNEAGTGLMRELYARAGTELLKQGAYFSRPYGAWAEPVFNRDWRGADTLKKLKKIFDPNGVMNPGKLIF